MSVGSLDGEGHLADLDQAGDQAVAERQRWLGKGRVVRNRRSEPHWPAEAADLQLVSNPPVEDSQVGVGREEGGAQVHLLVPPHHGHHLQVDFPQRCCETGRSALNWEKPGTGPAGSSLQGSGSIGAWSRSEGHLLDLGPGSGLTCDLDIQGGLGVAGGILRLHHHPVNSRLLVAVLDRLVGHGHVLVDGPDPVAQLHLVPGGAAVPLRGRGQVSAPTGYWPD